VQRNQPHAATDAPDAGQQVLAGETLTACGIALPHVTLTRRNGDQHRYSQTDRDSYTGIRAWWNDTAGSQRQAAIAGTEEKLKDLQHLLRHRSRRPGRTRAELHHIQPCKATFELTFAHGRADLMPETPLTLIGWKAGIDDAGWLATEVENSLDDNGYVTGIRCEVKSS
jgi:hypothetical protein